MGTALRGRRDTDGIKKPPRRAVRIHYAWIILLSCCALSGATLGTVINCKGLFFAPVCAELGCPVSAFTLYTMFYGLSAALMLLAVDRVFEKLPIRAVLTVSLAALCGATAAMGTFHRLSLWYAAGIVQGLAGAFLLYVPVPMLINHWFVRRRGQALGVAAVASGLAGAVMNPVLSAVISACGWRAAYFVQGGAAFLMAAPFTMFLIVKHPSDLGMTAYGAEAPPEGAPVVPRGNASPGAGVRGFAGCLLLAGVFTFCASYAQHLANYAAAIRLSEQAGAWMVSCSMLGNILGKALMGAGCDRWGRRRVCLFSLGLVTCGFLLLGLGRRWSVCLFAGALLSGVDHANMTVMVPMAVEAAAGPEEFDHMMSRASMSTMLASAFAATLIGGFYDFFGSYAAVFLFGAALQLVCMGLAGRLFAAQDS
ncbi:MFS transporter [Oscillibacter sp.]|uniref:MFS transporter n=1 Tax=Oscillibacter sp. TaxID=1945593 RepID=UPI002D7EC531|nr:MFS transporter [Oscillibacter sp.]